MTKYRLAAAFMFVVIASGALEPRDIARSAFPSTVVIETFDASGTQLALASGFAVAPGVLCTNLHVIDGATRVTAKSLTDNSQVEILGFTAVDAKNDLILLKSAGSDGMPALTLGSDEQIEVGDQVFVVGNPFGLEGTFSSGMLSAKRKIGDQYILQVTAPISPGNSGGPVLNSDGHVIGVTVSYLDGAQNVNFACPVSMLRSLVNTQNDPKQLGQTLPKSARPNSEELRSDKRISIGSVALRLGMGDQEATSALKKFYRLFPTTGEPGHYFVGDLNSTSTEPNILGEIVCRNGILIEASREHTRISDEATARAMVKFFQAMQEQLSKTSGQCVIKLDSEVRTISSIGQLNSYGVNFFFEDREIKLNISVGDPDKFSSGVDVWEKVSSGSSAKN